MRSILPVCTAVAKVGNRLRKCGRATPLPTSAMRYACANNLKQFRLASHNDASGNDSAFPARASLSPRILNNVKQYLLLYLELDVLFKSYNFSWGIIQRHG